MNSDLENKLKELKIGYLKKLEGILVELKDLYDTDGLLIEPVYVKVHTISGTSGMYGLSELSNISSNFELYLKDIREKTDTFSEDEFKNKFLNYINDIEKIISAGE